MSGFLFSCIVPCLLIVTAAASTNGRPIHFAAANTFSSGMDHSGYVAAGDFNGDGYPDLVVATTYSSVAVYLGTGTGSFGPPAIFTLTYYVTGQVVVGDFNGDGKLDFAVVGGDTVGNGLALFAGNGDGTFQPVQYFPTTLAGAEISAVTGNFSGSLDIFTGGNGSSMLILNDGKGTFSGSGPALNTYGFDVAAGDFNHDGRLDAAATQPSFAFSGAGVNVLLGNGDGTFQEPQLYSGMENPLGITTGDFNGDGKLDLAVTDYEADTVVILQGNGDGTFTNIGQFYAGFEPGSVAAADFNQDGNLDLAVSDYASDVLTILPGVGTGMFQSSFTVTTASAPSDVIAVDVNSDGSPDLVVVNNTANSISVLLNSNGTTVQLTGSPNPAKSGESVTFAAIVRASVAKTTPSGTVTFYDGKRPLETVPLIHGRALFNTSSLSIGSHSIAAAYSGSAQFNPNHSHIWVEKID